jgi:chloramphenicol 3-O phosphotransferase
MSTQVIVLNGGSSAGKSSIVRSLQDLLPQTWLTFGVDTLIEAMPRSLKRPGEGIDIAPDGQVVTGPEFERLDLAWSAGIAAMVRAGAHVVVDEVFLGQAASQRRWRTALDGLDVLWIGVRCDLEAAERRERVRGDRVIGQARSQWMRVHEGVEYDLEVDTTANTAEKCARLISTHVH